MRDRFPIARRATIRDVADAAGVSKATASKYLSDRSYYVSAKTAAKLDRAILELEYEPHSIAQSLANNRTMTIGVIVASLRNPFYPELIEGIEQVTDPAGYTLQIASTGSDGTREQRVARSMLNRQVDGVIMASVRMQAAEVERLMHRGAQVVLASRDLIGTPTDSVVVDNRGGARAATRHLLQHGHSRLGLVAGPEDIRAFTEREAGFHDAVREADLDGSSVSVARAESAVQGGFDAATQILTGPDAPTALFVCSDEMALGALDAVRHKGLAVPSEVAVMGFDNISFGARLAVPLSSVDSRAEDLGRRAAETLLQRLTGGDESNFSTQVLDTTLVLRRSCGCTRDHVEVVE